MSRELGRIAAPVDVGDLRRRERDDLVLLTAAVDEVEVVDVRRLNTGDLLGEPLDQLVGHHLLVGGEPGRAAAPGWVDVAGGDVGVGGVASGGVARGGVASGGVASGGVASGGVGGRGARLKEKSVGHRTAPDAECLYKPYWTAREGRFNPNESTLTVAAVP